MLRRPLTILLAAAAPLWAAAAAAAQQSPVEQADGEGRAEAATTLDPRAVVDRALRNGAEDPAYLGALGLPVGPDGRPDAAARSSALADRYLRSLTRDDLTALANALLGGASVRVHRPGRPVPSTDHCSRPFPEAHQVSASGRLDVEVRLAGLRYVTRLVRDGEAVCSAVVVGDRLAVTAAHCLDRSKDPASLVPQAGGSCRVPRQARLIALAPYDVPGSDRFSLVHGGTGQRVGEPQSGRLVRATEVCAHPEWLSAERNLDRDIALLRLAASPLPSGERAAELPAALAPVPPPLSVTVAGFGGTSRDPVIGSEFRVGWQQIDTFDRVYTALWEEAGRLSFACSGDSGGAVLAQRLRGCPSERALLVGLMVRTGAEAGRCSDLPPETALSILPLGADPVRGWIAEVRRRWESG